MNSASENPRDPIETATKALEALPYLGQAQTNAPDYWVVPAAGGYESGYTTGLEMARACLCYLRRSPLEDGGPDDGHTHLHLVISRLAERVQGASVGAQTSEASLTLKGHLAGFCSALEASCRRPSQPDPAVAARKAERRVTKTPGRGKRCR